MSQRNQEGQIMIVNFSEALDEAKQLTKNLRRDVEVKSVNCDCDYSRDCGKCAASGIYYELVFSFCGHPVANDDRCEACFENFCAEREQAQSEDLEAETFPAQHKPLSPVWANESEAA